MDMAVSQALAYSVAASCKLCRQPPPTGLRQRVFHFTNCGLDRLQQRQHSYHTLSWSGCGDALQCDLEAGGLCLSPADVHVSGALARLFRSICAGRYPLDSKNILVCNEAHNKHNRSILYYVSDIRSYHYPLLGWPRSSTSTITSGYNVCLGYD